MKVYLSLIAAAVALAACGGENKPAETAAPASEVVASTPETSSEASAVSASETAADEAAAKPEAVASAECSVVIDGNDQMKFDRDEITVKSSCEQYTITLKHSGAMPAAAMGHNVVITKAADKDAVVAESAAAGLDADYVKADDARVLVHTKLIGGGEETSVTFDPKKLEKGTDYVFFCSFPAHATAMHGKVNLVD